MPGNPGKSAWLQAAGTSALLLPDTLTYVPELHPTMHKPASEGLDPLMSHSARDQRRRVPIWRRPTVLAVAVLFAAGIYFLITTVNDSKRLEQTLIDRYGPAVTYSPPMDGILTPERIQKFIRVRKAVQSSCANSQSVLNSILSLDAMETDQETPAAEKLSSGLNSFKGIFGAAPRLLEFMDARNTALLEQEMGLGEYMYLYLATYGPQLAQEPESLYAGMEEAYVSRRTRLEYAEILTRQRATLETAGPSVSNEQLATQVTAQLEALNDTADSTPWPNDLTGPVNASLAPFREQLTSLYCSGIVQTELKQKNRHFSFTK